MAYLPKEIEWRNEWFIAKRKDLPGNKFRVEAEEKDKAGDFLVNLGEHQERVWQLVYYMMGDLLKAEDKVKDLELKLKNDEHRAFPIGNVPRIS